MIQETGFLTVFLQGEVAIFPRGHWELTGIFANELGRPHHYRNLAQRHFASILKTAGLAGLGFTPYSLRHTTATLLLAASENVKVISERLGHTTTRMTLDTYAHSLPNSQAAATEAG